MVTYYNMKTAGPMGTYSNMVNHLETFTIIQYDMVTYYNMDPYTYKIVCVWIDVLSLCLHIILYLQKKNHDKAMARSWCFEIQ